jgi:REP-associated tyrosine transposase
VSRKRESSANLTAGATYRRSIRLGGYDYAHPDAYFVTVCAVRCGPLFGEISDGRVVENSNGSIVRDCWLDLPNHYPHVSLDTFVVMPDHIHGIIVLRETDGAGGARAGLKPAPTGGSGSADVGVRHGLPEIVRALKTYSARRINARCGTPGAPVWQRDYYERIIRNERELDRTRKYIASNPRNWRTDHEHNKTHR